MTAGMHQTFIKTDH